MRRICQGANEGIQGNVRAEVLAVGRNARASKTVRISSAEHAELETAVQQLQTSIASLPLSGGAREMLTADVNELTQAIGKEEPEKDRVGGILEKISGKLRMLGDISKNISEVVVPLAKIAGVFHLSTTLLALL